jgi:hypothetical protein
MREHDGRCVITGCKTTRAELLRNEWVDLEAAHIFPLALDAIFTNYNSGPLVVLDMNVAAESILPRTAFFCEGTCILVLCNI